MQCRNGVREFGWKGKKRFRKVSIYEIWYGNQVVKKCEKREEVKVVGCGRGGITWLS